MARGFKTGGRKKGSKNKRSLLLEGAARQLLDDAKRILGDETFEGDAHALLMLTYKNKSLPLAVRLDAAKEAGHVHSGCEGIDRKPSVHNQ
jgi:hypothetical protein